MSNLQNHNPKHSSQNRQAPPMGQEMAQIVEICKTLSTCPFYQKIGTGGVLAIWLTAKELGLPTMACLNGGLYTFDGKVTLSAQMMNMMIVNAGHRADVLQLDEKGCKIRFVRSDRQKGNGDTFEYEFNYDMAQRAGYLTKDVWKKHSRDMFYSRCLSGGARKFMPDVLMNYYVAGEIEGSEEQAINVPIEISERAHTPSSASSENLLPLQSSENFETFVSRHGLIEGEPSAKNEYIDFVAKKSNLTRQNVIAFAVKHEEAFLEKFDKWLEEQKSYREDSEDHIEFPQQERSPETVTPNTEG